MKRRHYFRILKMVNLHKISTETLWCTFQVLLNEPRWKDIPLIAIVTTTDSEFSDSTLTNKNSSTVDKILISCCRFWKALCHVHPSIVSIPSCFQLSLIYIRAQKTTFLTKNRWWQPKTKLTWIIATCTFKIETSSCIRGAETNRTLS